MSREWSCWKTYSPAACGGRYGASATRGAARAREEFNEVSRVARETQFRKILFVFICFIVELDYTCSNVVKTNYYVGFDIRCSWCYSGW
ncbi:hypothetical protein HanHA300_Chr09g0335271 [Helianthus annuus]|nr:hypothetical protein HanHA300_Chr09g0335271 [Helianthus annuus]KAJ0543965.1 hypothetical protein HanHA89_Chr09g0356331 [Helianthus annuus]KAJ0709021.1 hypothetical protein HanLR1_Chr09g0335621 [Helianthus annuus]